MDGQLAPEARHGGLGRDHRRDHPWSGDLGRDGPHDSTDDEGGTAAGAASGPPWGALTGELELLPGPGGWHVVRLDAERSRRLRAGARRGMVPVTASLGATCWDTSLMPMGDGTLFLPVPAAVRRAEDLHDGDDVRAGLRPRPAAGPSRAPGPSPRRP